MNYWTTFQSNSSDNFSIKFSLTTLRFLFVCGHTLIINYESALRKTCHALTPTVLGCPSAYEMQYAISQQFMLIYLIMHILTKFTHKQHFIHFSNNNTPNGPNLGRIENRAPLGPFTVHHRIIGIPKHTTKLKDISPMIKTKPQHSPGLPKNSPKNHVQTVRKQS